MMRVLLLCNFLLSVTVCASPLKTEVPMKRKIIEIDVKNKTLMDFLSSLQGKRKQAILKFHEEYLDLISSAKGSKSKHQDWPGGYQDHLTEMMSMGEQMYTLFSARRKLPFTFDQVIVVSYFHDLEKVFKYTTGKEIDKPDWYARILPERGITFDSQEQNALKYIHGEGPNDYNPDTRVMNELAAFCHAIDNLSARMWYQRGKGTGAKGALKDED